MGRGLGRPQMYLPRLPREARKARKEKVKKRKNNPNHIWFLTALWVEIICKHPTSGEIKTKRDCHTFGYYRGFDKAYNAVTKNMGDMHECLYQYLVMERIGEGVHSPTTEAIWFKFGRKKWNRCLQPQWARGFTNWALG